MNHFTIPQHYTLNLLVLLKEILKYSMVFDNSTARGEGRLRKSTITYWCEAHHESEATPFIHAIVCHKAWRKHFQSVT